MGSQFVNMPDLDPQCVLLMLALTHEGLAFYDNCYFSDGVLEKANKDEGSISCRMVTALAPSG